VLRSATTWSSRARSSGVTWISIPVLMRTDSHIQAG
jgi:hypothetical protein